MSIIKTTSLALAAAAVVVATAGVASAAPIEQDYIVVTHSSLPDNNVSTSSLSGLKFFDRIANQGQ